MTVKEIVAEYLAANGYGGLHYDECGCFDDDLFPCGECSDQCEAAYKVPVHCDTCECDCDSRGEKGVEFCLTMAEPAQKNIEAGQHPPTAPCRAELPPQICETQTSA